MSSVLAMSSKVTEAGVEVPCLGGACRGLCSALTVSPMWSVCREPPRKGWVCQHVTLSLWQRACGEPRGICPEAAWGMPSPPTHVRASHESLRGATCWLLNGTDRPRSCILCGAGSSTPSRSLHPQQWFSSPLTCPLGKCKPFMGIHG